MIKAYLFDYGGVITSGGAGDEMSKRLAQNLGISFAEGSRLFGVGWGGFVTGRITEDQLWQKIEAAYGVKIPVGKTHILNTWAEHMRPIPEMIELIGELKANGLVVGLLSNVNPVTAKDIRAHGGYDAFDFTILSCDVGFAKPDKEIYELALAKLPGIQPEEVVFVDDQERCLVPARAMGIETILAQTPEQVRTDSAHLND
jgi:epoxide hydrolase-like predicted phosphatase